MTLNMIIKAHAMLTSCGLYATVRYLKNRGKSFSQVIKSLAITDEIEFNYVKTLYVK